MSISNRDSNNDSPKHNSTTWTRFFISTRQ